MPIRIQRKRTRGYDMQAESRAVNGLDISDMLPPVVREMPVRKAARDDVGRMLGGG